MTAKRFVVEVLDVTFTRLVDGGQFLAPRVTLLGFLPAAVVA